MLAANTSGEEREIAAEGLLELGMATSSQARPDLVDAHKWFSLAAALGNREAAERRKELTLEMSPADLTAAQRAARQWLDAH